MSSKKRGKSMLEALHPGEELSVKELAEQFETSEITVRRDLTALAEKGLVVRTHGGVMLPDKTAFVQKDLKFSSAKAHIGKLAAAQVSPGDIIFMDCGSTVFQMCAFLNDITDLTIITNSLPVANELAGQSSIRINLVGGELDTARKAVHGAMAVEHITRYRANKAFVGTDGFSLAGGLSSHSEMEASITLGMARQSKFTYLLCDASKLENDSYYQYAPVLLVNFLITDPAFDRQLEKPYTEAGVRLLY